MLIARVQAVYQSLLHLSWVDNLLDVVRALFARQYVAELKTPHAPSPTAFRAFEPTFDALVQKLDTGSSARRPSEPDSEGPAELTPSSSSAGEEAVDEPPPPPVPGFLKPALPRAPVVQDYSTSTDATPVPTPDTSRPSTPSSHLLTAKGGPGKASRRARKANAAVTSAPASSGDESPAGRPRSTAKGSVKQKRRWDNDGFAADGDEDTVLD